jgi:hypothetical protein
MSRFPVILCISMPCVESAAFRKKKGAEEKRQWTNVFRVTNVADRMCAYGLTRKTSKNCRKLFRDCPRTSYLSLSGLIGQSSPESHGCSSSLFVMPVRLRRMIRHPATLQQRHWIPAFTGMTAQRQPVTEWVQNVGE